MVNSIIAHLDMDAFFAAIEERDNPRFSGFPIVVGADPKGGVGRGVVSTANYKAREYGIHSAMPISTAWRLSEKAVNQSKPKTVFLPVNGVWYSEVSRKIFAIVAKFSSRIEQVSIDEAFIDLSFFLNFHTAEEEMKRLKREIYVKERLTATVGIGPNKLVAKLASTRFKPDGLTVIFPQKVEEFLECIHLIDIPGIGPKTYEVLRQKGISSVKELKKIAEQDLILWLGKWGKELFQKIRGIDRSPIELEHELKSVSEQETFEKDERSPSYLLGELHALSVRVFERVVQSGIKGFKTVTIMVRFDDFETKTRSHSLPEYVLSKQVLQTESLKLFIPFLDRRQNPKKKACRLLGVGVSNFKNEYTSFQPNLFSTEV